MKNFGKVKPGSTLYVDFDTFGSSGESLTMSGLAVTDIEIYKDGGTTQRASDNGYTLLDTDGIDFDGLTGIHGFSINLADNSDAGFYAAGSKYRVVVSTITVNTQTVSFTAATFEIEIPNALLSTTIATLASQTSFTLTAGPAEDDALNGCVVYIHDVASAVQGGFAVVQDYTGASKTVTLAAGTTFTAAATDNIGFFPPANISYILGAAISTTTAQLGVNVVQAGGTNWGSGSITAGVLAADCITSAKVGPGALVYDDQITTFKSELSGLVIAIPNGHITSAKIGADAIGSDKVAAGAFDYGDQIVVFDASIKSAASSAWSSAAAVYRVYPADGAITAAVLGADCITSAKVAAGAFVYDDQITTFKSELSGMVVTLPDGHITAAKIGADAITSAKVAAGALTYDDQITTFKSEISGVYTRLTTQGVRDITQYTSAHVSAFPGSSPALIDALYWNYSMNGYKRLQQPTSFVIYDAAGTTKIASATVSGTSAEVIIGTFQ